MIGSEEFWGKMWEKQSKQWTSKGNKFGVYKLYITSDAFQLVSVNII